MKKSDVLAMLYGFCTNLQSKYFQRAHSESKEANQCQSFESSVCNMWSSRFLAHAGDKVEPASAFLVWAKSARPPLRVKKILT